MKFWKRTLITSFAFFGITGTVLYTSCVKDSCTDLKCKNAGSCADGYCHCPSGYEGAECETKIATRFLGRYVGTVRCDSYPSLVDTVDVFMKTEPLTVAMVRRGNRSDTIIGTTTGNNVIVPDFNGGNTTKTVTALIENKKFSLFVENVTSVSAHTKSVCNFIGFKP